MKVAAMVAAALMFALLSYPSPAVAKPQPPKELQEIFRTIEQIETGFKSGAWDKALSFTGRVETQFKAISDRIRKDANPTIVNDLEIVLKNFRISLVQKDPGRSNNGLIMLQRLLFEIMMAYDYKKPPIFTVIDQYIGEAAESAEKSDFTNVVSEMKEVDALFRLSRQLLAERGARIGDMDEVASLIQETIQAGSAGDRKASESLLKKLRAKHKAVTAR